MLPSWPACSAVNVTPEASTVTRPALTPRSGSSVAGLVLIAARWTSRREDRRLWDCHGLGLRKLIGHLLRLWDVIGADGLADRGHGSPISDAGRLGRVLPLLLTRPALPYLKLLECTEIGQIFLEGPRPGRPGT